MVQRSAPKPRWARQEAPRTPKATLLCAPPPLPHARPQKQYHLLLNARIRQGRGVDKQRLAPAKSRVCGLNAGLVCTSPQSLLRGTYNVHSHACAVAHATGVHDPTVAAGASCVGGRASRAAQSRHPVHLPRAALPTGVHHTRGAVDGCAVGWQRQLHNFALMARPPGRTGAHLTQGRTDGCGGPTRARDT